MGIIKVTEGLAPSRLKRYDLNEISFGMITDHLMEEADDGEWVKAAEAIDLDLWLQDLMGLRSEYMVIKTENSRLLEELSTLGAVGRSLEVENGALRVENRRLNDIAHDLASDA